MDFLKDIWFFLKERKKFWLAPLILILLLFGLLLIFAGSSAVAPFIYTLFWYLIGFCRSLFYPLSILCFDLMPCPRGRENTGTDLPPELRCCRRKTYCLFSCPKFGKDPTV